MNNLEVITKDSNFKKGNKEKFYCQSKMSGICIWNMLKFTFNLPSRVTVTNYSKICHSHNHMLMSHVYISICIRNMKKFAFNLSSTVTVTCQSKILQSDVICHSHMSHITVTSRMTQITVTCHISKPHIT